MTDTSWHCNMAHKAWSDQLSVTLRLDKLSNTSSNSVSDIPVTKHTRYLSTISLSRLRSFKYYCCSSSSLMTNHGACCPCSCFGDVYNLTPLIQMLHKFKSSPSLSPFWLNFHLTLKSPTCINTVASILVSVWSFYNIYSFISDTRWIVSSPSALLFW